MDKIKKYSKIIVSIFCLLAVNCVFCNTEDGDKIVIFEAGSSNNSSIADLGDNQYRVEFSYPDYILHIKFEMIGLDGSTSYITIQREIQKTYIPPDDVNIQKNYYRYIAYGRLNNASDPSIPYYAYIIRDDKDNILAKGKVPELRASLRDSTVTTDSRTLVLTNNYTKPIVISGITNLIYDENLEASEEFTKEKVIPVGGTYDIELRPTTCSGEKTQKKLNDLYVVVYYKIDGIEKKLACVFDLTFFCNAKSNLVSSVVTGGAAAIIVTALIMEKETVVKILKDLRHRIRNLKKGSNHDQDKKTDDPKDSDDDDNSPDSDNRGDGFDKKPPHDYGFKPKPFHRKSKADKKILPKDTIVTVTTIVQTDRVEGRELTGAVPPPNLAVPTTVEGPRTTTAIITVTPPPPLNTAVPQAITDAPPQIPTITTETQINQIAIRELTRAVPPPNLVVPTTVEGPRATTAIITVMPPPPLNTAVPQAITDAPPQIPTITTETQINQTAIRELTRTAPPPSLVLPTAMVAPRTTTIIMVATTLPVELIRSMEALISIIADEPIPSRYNNIIRSVLQQEDVPPMLPTAMRISGTTATTIVATTLPIEHIRAMEALIAIIVNAPPLPSQRSNATQNILQRLQQFEEDLDLPHSALFATSSASSSSAMSKTL